MKKSDNLGAFETSEVAHDGPCGLVHAQYYGKTVDSEIVLWDNNEEVADGDVLAHFYGSGNSYVGFNKSKAVSDGIFVQVVDGTCGVIISIEP